MLKGIIIGLMSAISFAAGANTLPVALVQMQMPAVMDQARTQGLDWKVGDSASYNIDAGFIKGSMVMTVKSNNSEGIWMDQNMDMGFAGKQQVQTLLDPNTGEIKKMIVNGKEQTPPKNNVEVIDVKEDKITVPAGTFECVHARLKDKDKNEEINAWINPSVIPLSGMLKQTAPSQLGQVTVVLKSFKKN